MKTHIFVWLLLATLFARAELGCSQSVFIPPIELRALPANLGNSPETLPKIFPQTIQTSSFSPGFIQQGKPIQRPPQIVITPPREPPPAPAAIITDTDHTDLHKAVHNFLNVFAVNTSDHRSAENELESRPTERKSQQGYTYWKPHYWDSPEYEEPYQPYHGSGPYESRPYGPPPYPYDLPTYQHAYGPSPYPYGPPLYEAHKHHPKPIPPPTTAPTPAPTVKPIALKPAVPIVPATISPLLLKKTEAISTLISSLATAATGVRTPTGLISGILQVALATLARKGLRGLVGKLALPIAIIVLVNILIVVLIWFLWEECPVVAPPAQVPPPPPTTAPTPSPTPYPYHYPLY